MFLLAVKLNRKLGCPYTIFNHTLKGTTTVEFYVVPAAHDVSKTTQVFFTGHFNVTPPSKKDAFIGQTKFFLKPYIIFWRFFLKVKTVGESSISYRFVENTGAALVRQFR